MVFVFHNKSFGLPSVHCVRGRKKKVSMSRMICSFLGKLVAQNFPPRVEWLGTQYRAGHLITRVRFTKYNGESNPLDSFNGLGLDLSQTRVPSRRSKFNDWTDLLYVDLKD